MMLQRLALFFLVLPVLIARAGFVQPSGWELGTTMPDSRSNAVVDSNEFSVVSEMKSESFLFSRDTIPNAELNKDRDQMVKEGIDSILRKTNASLLSSTPVVVAGNSAIRVLTESVGSEARLAEFIIILKEKEVYMFYYSTSNSTLESPDSKRFFADISNAK